MHFLATLALPLVVAQNAPTGGQVALRTETRLRFEPGKPDSEIVEVELKPVLRGRLTLGRERLELGYEPKIIARDDGSRVDDLHRITASWQSRRTRRLQLWLKQKIEVGRRDFRFPAARSSAPEPIEEDLDGPEDAEAAPTEEEEGGLDEPEPVEEVALDDLPDIEVILVLTSDTRVGARYALTARQQLEFEGRFVRGGALEQEFQSKFPERLNPSVRAQWQIGLTSRDQLRVSTLGSYERFSSGPESLLWRADVTWLRKLAANTALRLGIGITGVWYVAFDGWRVDPAPTATLELSHELRWRRHSVRLALDGNLGPYVSPVNGRADARRAYAGARVTYRHLLGAYVSLTEGVTSTLLDDYSPQGAQSVFSASFGYRFKTHVGIEAGVRNLYSIKPAPPGKPAPAATERWAVFAALHLDSGMLSRKQPR